MDSEYQKVKRQWFKDNPPNHQGYYTCGICGAWVKKEEVVLDHIEPHGGEASLKYDGTNLQPSHWSCNQRKGSRRGFKLFSVESAADFE